MEERVEGEHVVDLAALAQRTVRAQRADIAVRVGEETRTFGELDDRARRLSSALAGLGLQRGDRVGVLLHNRIEYPEIDLALLYGGYVRVALNVRMKVADFLFALDDCGARALITSAEFDESATEIADALDLAWLRLESHDLPKGAVDYPDAVRAAALAPVIIPDSPEETAWISYTSGTTGKPKGVVLSRRALMAVAENLVLELGVINGDARMMLTQPLSHGAGYFAMAYVAAGGSITILPSFDPEEAFHLARKHDIPAIKLVPTTLASLIEVPGDSPFEHIIYGASPISPVQLDRALGRFGPVLTQVYGQSEIPVTITVLGKREHLREGNQRASAGRIWRTLEARILAEDGTELPVGELGELVVRGPQTMTGYWGRPDLTSEVLRDGWVHTKDLAVMDELGFIYLRGRRDDMIISGGFNVAPREVEDVLCGYTGVVEACVLGMPDEKWGQRVVAFVRAEGVVTAESLAAFADDRLGFRKPREYHFIETLPTNAYGKVDRKQLRDLAIRA
jgi:acyl-CoA synthetase (AMP-forming)/AMP-acid ligase II